MTSAPAAEVVRFLREEHADAAELALWVRDQVLAAEPDFGERVYRGWNGIGFRHPDAGYVCAIFPRGDHVRLLFEHGRSLGDEHGVLEPSGSQTATLRVDASDQRTARLIAELVHDAVAGRLFR